jgi:hypothetical protein
MEIPFYTYLSVGYMFVEKKVNQLYEKFLKFYNLSKISH